MVKKKTQGALYTAEAAESKRRAKAERSVPDPSDEEGRAIIEGGGTPPQEEEADADEEDEA